MDQSQVVLLRDKLSDARESCCGSNVQKKTVLMSKLDQLNALCVRISPPLNMWSKIQEAIKIVKKSKEYCDRLPADDLLCEALEEVNAFE